MHTRGTLVLNEYGFLPVPPPCHDVRFTELPGVFGNGGSRAELWLSVQKFSRLLIERTTIREFYLDGDYISAHDKPPAVEVGIELSDGVTDADLKTLYVTSIDGQLLRARTDRMGISA